MDRARGLQLATERQLRLFGETTSHLLVVDMRGAPATACLVERLLEGIDHLGVELGTGVASQLGDGVLLGEGHPIGASRRHRVEGIGGGDDAGLDPWWLTLAVPAAPVATAVEIAVMAGGDLDHGLEEVDLGEDLLDELGVRLHLGVFVLIEPAPLAN